MVGIGELSLSKFKYEILQISKDFIKLSECVKSPCENLSPLFKTFWRWFWFLTPYLFTRQFSCIRFLPVRKSKKHANSEQVKAQGFYLGFRGISRLGSAFFFLRCFKLAHICIQVTSLHKCNKQEINHRFLSLAYFTWGVKLRESWT